MHRVEERDRGAVAAGGEHEARRALRQLAREIDGLAERSRHEHARARELLATRAGDAGAALSGVEVHDDGDIHGRTSYGCGPAALVSSLS